MNSGDVRRLALGLQSGASLTVEAKVNPMVSDILELARETGAPRAQLLLLACVNHAPAARTRFVTTAEKSER